MYVKPSLQSFPRGQTLGLIIQSGYNFSIISTLFLKVAILSHFRDQKKYFSQAVRNTLIVLEKYSPPYLRNTADHTYVYGKCPLPTTSTEQSMLSLSVSTLALHIVSALIL